MKEKQNLRRYSCSNCNFRVYVTEITRLILNMKRSMEWQSLNLLLYVNVLLQTTKNT